MGASSRAQFVRFSHARDKILWPSKYLTCLKRPTNSLFSLERSLGERWKMLSINYSVSVGSQLEIKIGSLTGTTWNFFLIRETVPELPITIPLRPPTKRRGSLRSSMILMRRRKNERTLQKLYGATVTFISIQPLRKSNENR